MSEFPWIDLLTSWSQELVSSGQNADGLPVEVIESGWLGFPGATEQELAAAEARLGTILPPSYRAFLRVTNGWRMTTGFAGGLRPVEDVGWLADEDPALIETWIMGELGLGSPPIAITDAEYHVYGERVDQPFRSEYLRTALAISDRRNGIYLLNPQTVTSDGEWEAWFFAPWVPGADRYRSFWEMMEAEHERFVFVLKRTQGLPTPRADPSLGVGADDFGGLLAALRDPEQRLAALDALGNLRDARAFDAVLMVFQDQAENLLVREEAARTLGRLGDPRAIQPLLDAFRTSPEEMGRLTLNALLGSGQAGEELPDSLASGLGELLDRLGGALGTPMADHLRSTLTPEAVGQGYADHLNHAVRQGLLELGDAAFPELFDALEDSDPGVRREVASLLCYARRREGVFERLLSTFADPDPSVRAALASHIEQLFEPHAVDPLLTALEDVAAPVRVAAARSLGIVGRRGADRRVAAALAAASEQDPEPQVRRVAAQSLRSLGRR
jgi:HEAT repeat protein